MKQVAEDTAWPAHLVCESVYKSPERGVNDECKGILFKQSGSRDFASLKLICNLQHRGGLGKIKNQSFPLERGEKRARGS